MADTVADIVRVGLRSAPKKLSAELFYDALGSRLFDAICELPWYPLTRTEKALLEEHAAEMLGRPSLLVELGGGSGEKLALLVDARREAHPLEVHLVDVSQKALDLARGALAAKGLSVHTHNATYEAGLRLAMSGRSDGASHDGSDREGGALVLFLGSNIGNFDGAGAARMLAEVRAALRPGDALLLGTDLCKPQRELELAYDDPLGITAAFNLNLLVRLNRELGSDFDVTRFSHLARWDAARASMDSFLVAKVAHDVHFSSLALTVHFAAGEPVWTESSHKYTPEGVRAMALAAGFACARQWTDARPNFAVSRLIAR